MCRCGAATFFSKFVTCGSPGVLGPHHGASKAAGLPSKPRTMSTDLTRGPLSIPGPTPIERSRRRTTMTVPLTSYSPLASQNLPPNRLVHIPNPLPELPYMNETGSGCALGLQTCLLELGFERLGVAGDGGPESFKFHIGGWGHPIRTKLGLAVAWDYRLACRSWGLRGYDATVYSCRSMSTETLREIAAKPRFLSTNPQNNAATVRWNHDPSCCKRTARNGVHAIAN